jgi:thioredoxin-related protein
MRSFAPLRTVVFVAVLLLAVGVGTAHAQMEMPPRSFGEVVERAEAQGTPILLEIYAPWCPYCQKMQEAVYTDAEIRSYLDRTFTYARLNRDTTAGSHRFKGRTLSSKQLGFALGARGVPTTVFLKADGTPIASQPGFIKRDTFLQLIRYVGSGAYESTSFKAFRKRSSE